MPLPEGLALSRHYSTVFDFDFIKNHTNVHGNVVDRIQALHSDLDLDSVSLIADQYIREKLRTDPVSLMRKARLKSEASKGETALLSMGIDICPKDIQLEDFRMYTNAKEYIRKKNLPNFDLTEGVTDEVVAKYYDTEFIMLKKWPKDIVFVDKTIRTIDDLKRFKIYTEKKRNTCEAKLSKPTRGNSAIDVSTISRNTAGSKSHLYEATHSVVSYNTRSDKIVLTTSAKETIHSSKSKKNRVNILPKDISFEDFRQLTNVENLIRSDILCKFPNESDKYLEQIDKHIQKYYKDQFVKLSAWPRKIVFNDSSIQTLQDIKRLKCQKSQVGKEKETYPVYTPCFETSCNLTTKRAYVDNKTVSSYSIVNNRGKKQKEFNSMTSPNKCSYQDFRNFTNIEQLVHDDLKKRFSDHSAYLKGIEKYIRKYYNNHLIKLKKWPKKIHFCNENILKNANSDCIEGQIINDHLTEEVQLEIETSKTNNIDKQNIVDKSTELALNSQSQHNSLISAGNEKSIAEPQVLKSQPQHNSHTSADKEKLIAEPVQTGDDTVNLSPDLFSSGNESDNGKSSATLTSELNKTLIFCDVGNISKAHGTTLIQSQNCDPMSSESVNSDYVESDLTRMNVSDLTNDLNFPGECETIIPDETDENSSVSTATEIFQYGNVKRKVNHVSLNSSENPIDTMSIKVEREYENILNEPEPVPVTNTELQVLHTLLELVKSEVKEEEVDIEMIDVAKLANVAVLSEMQNNSTTSGDHKDHDQRLLDVESKEVENLESLVLNLSPKKEIHADVQNSDKTLLPDGEGRKKNTFAESAEKDGEQDHERIACNQPMLQDKSTNTENEINPTKKDKKIKGNTNHNRNRPQNHANCDKILGITETVIIPPSRTIRINYLHKADGASAGKETEKVVVQTKSNSHATIDRVMTTDPNSERIPSSTHFSAREAPKSECMHIPKVCSREEISKKVTEKAPTDKFDSDKLARIAKICISKFGKNKKVSKRSFEERLLAEFSAANICTKISKKVKQNNDLGEIIVAQAKHHFQPLALVSKFKNGKCITNETVKRKAIEPPSTQNKKRKSSYTDPDYFIEDASQVNLDLSQMPIGKKKGNPAKKASSPSLKMANTKSCNAVINVRSRESSQDGTEFNNYTKKNTQFNNYIMEPCCKDLKPHLSYITTIKIDSIPNTLILSINYISTFPLLNFPANMQFQAKTVLIRDYSYNFEIYQSSLRFNVNINASKEKDLLDFLVAIKSPRPISCCVSPTQAVSICALQDILSRFRYFTLINIQEKMNFGVIASVSVTSNSKSKSTNSAGNVLMHKIFAYLNS